MKKSQRLPKKNLSGAGTALKAINAIERGEEKALSVLLDKSVDGIVYAGLIKRLGALTIDIIVLALVFVLVMLVGTLFNATTLFVGYAITFFVFFGIRACFNEVFWNISI